MNEMINLGLDVFNDNKKSTIYYYKALILNKLKKTNEAIEYLRKSVTLNKNNKEAQETLNKYLSSKISKKPEIFKNPKISEISKTPEISKEINRCFEFYGFKNDITLEEIEKHLGSKTLYEILGINKNATKSGIKKAYHKLSLKCHPDKISDENMKKINENIFKIIGDTYKILKDPKMRELYDQKMSVYNELPKDHNLVTESADMAEEIKKFESKCKVQ
jgi:tetratricopeptide (TPR) repeat protein